MAERAAKERTARRQTDSEVILRVRGVEHVLPWKAWDADTYEHRSGCLAYRNSNGACQCGALDRTSRIYEGDGFTVLVPAPSEGWHVDG